MTSNTTRLFGSHYFNILPENLMPASSSSSASASATTTSEISAASSTNSATVASATDAKTSVAPSQIGSAGIDSTTKTAVGVGVGVGVPLIAVLAAIAYFLYKSHKRKNARSARTTGYGDHSQISSPPAYPIHGETNASKYNPTVQQRYPPSEMSGNNYHEPADARPVELS